MSATAITLRCDHDGCVKTTDGLNPQVMEGWLQNTMPVLGSVRMVLDYCPDHAAAHVMPEGLAAVLTSPRSVTK